jgi:hypothetical protein
MKERHLLGSIARAVLKIGNRSHQAFRCGRVRNLLAGAPADGRNYGRVSYLAFVRKYGVIPVLNSCRFPSIF